MDVNKREADFASLDIIKGEISMQEIERKFLVNDIKNLDLSKYKSKHIIQNYLYEDAFTVIRKRKIVENNNVKYIYTVKTNKSEGYGIEEFEKEITKEEYNNLANNTKYNEIDKIRYIIPLEDGLNIELDVFEKEYNGIIFAEIEFPSEEMAKNYKIPDWFGKELSKKISNSKMARNDAKKMKKEITNLLV